MTFENKLNKGGASLYESPSVTSLEVLSEGVLCGSYGAANEAGKMLQENEDNTWDF
jgi:hypothetical protein